MKPKWLFPTILIVLVTLACNLGVSPDNNTEKTETPKKVIASKTPKPLTPTNTSEPEDKPTATETASVETGSITDLEQAEKGVFRIEVAGGFELPAFGDFQQNWSGSGFIIDPSGLAITNNHVVTGAATLKVFFYGETKPRNARILGASECSDLAVIDLEGDDYPFFDWYTDDVKLGMDVFSLGFPLNDPELTRHKGTISKRAADISTNWTSVNSVLEHDAIINPGSSGGPLITENGRVVGVNYAQAQTYDQYYAITYKEVKSILEDLKEGKNVMWVGINGEAFVSEDASLSGILVYSVASGSPADKAGIKSGDILVKMEGISLAEKGTMKEYCDILRSKGDEASLKVRVFRYSTGEFLEGQINGKPLVVTEKGNTGQSGQNNQNNQGQGGQGNQGNDNKEQAPAFFRDEFENGLGNYFYFFMHGKDREENRPYSKDGKLVFHIADKQTYVYLAYDPYTYDNVLISAEAENRGVNTNNLSLICRYVPDEGFYEFIIYSSGLYEIWRFKDKYELLYNGGSKHLKMGKETNQFAAECDGKNLTLFINGYKERTVTDSTFKEGRVGLGVSTLDSVPVEVEFEYFEIAKP